MKIYVKNFVMAILLLVGIGGLQSCYEPVEETHSTMWFYSFEKYTFAPTVYVDGVLVGSVNYYISGAGDIDCSSSLGLIHRVQPGTYYIEVQDHNRVPILGGDITVSEGGKCHPILVD